MGLILGSGTTKPQYPYDMWYGVQGDFTSKDYKLTRIGNMDLHRTLPIQNKLRRFVENTDGSVKYYLHQNDSRKTETGAQANLDTTDGNVMLEKPEYYAKFEIDGTKWALCISEYPLPGFVLMSRKTCSPWFATIDSKNNTAVSGSWLQWDGDEIKRDENGFYEPLASALQFRGGQGLIDTKYDRSYNSRLGMPRTSINKGSVRVTCRNGTHIGFARIYSEIAWLQRIEYASLNCQDTYIETLTEDGFHQGGLGMDSNLVHEDTHWLSWGGNIRAPIVPCGVTAILGNNTGRVAYPIKNWGGGDRIFQVVSYRGLETPFEYLWAFADDILAYYDGNICKLYGCSEPSKFISQPQDSPNIPDGYKLYTELPIYIEAGSGMTNVSMPLNFAFSYEGFTFPTKVGGEINQGMCDEFRVMDKHGWMSPFLGGQASHWFYAGFAAMNSAWTSTYSFSYCGFRLCRF